MKPKTSPDNSDGSLLSDQEYARQRMDLLKEKANLDELLQDTSHRVDKWLELSENTFEFACTAHERFATGDLQTKKEILATIGSNLMSKDKKRCLEAKTPFLLLEKSLLRYPQEKGPIEPENLIGLGRGYLPHRRVEADACTSGRAQVKARGNLFDREPGLPAQARRYLQLSRITFAA